MEGERNPLGSCLLKGLVLLVVFGLIGCSLSGSVVWITGKLFQQSDPEGYRQFVSETLGTEFPETQVKQDGEVTSTSLAPGPTKEKADLAKKTGYSADLLDRAAMVADWMDKKFGEGTGDWTVYVALTTGESANCSNPGTSPVLAQYRTHSILSKTIKQQEEALKAFIAVWKKYDIRKKNPIAAAHLSEDYDPEKVLGSALGGAMGCSQFIATTAYIHFNEIEDPKDLWDSLTAMKMMALELKRIGWSKNANIAQKALTLLKWNNHPSWTQSIAQTADGLKKYLNAPSQTLQVRLADDPLPVEEGQDKDWKLVFLDWIGLGVPEPEVEEIQITAEAPKTTPPPHEVIADRIKVGEWKLPIAGKPKFTSGAAEHRSRGSAIGWDLAVGMDVQIFAAKTGKVELASCGDGSRTANFGYGCMILIRHDDKTQTRYGHLNGVQGLKVKTGDEVTQDMVIGLMGSTGNSTGPHLHFEIIINGAAQDPTNYFGTPQSLGLPLYLQ